MISVLATDGEACGFVVGRLNPRAATGFPAYIDAAPLTASPDTRALTELVWGSYVAAAVLGDARMSRLSAGADPVGLRSLFWTRPGTPERRRVITARSRRLGHEPAP